jgi:uridylate kinase
MAESGKRVLLKISGEALADEQRFGIDAATLNRIASQIKAALANGTQIGIVVGAGNIMRGSAIGGERGVERVTADYAGMLATIINSLALQSALERQGIDVCVHSAIPVQEVVEAFACRRAIEHLEEGGVVIFAGGTGNPYFTTDTAAALRAVEIGAHLVLMAKNKVDGVYEGNPRKTPGVRRFERLSYQEAIDRRLEVMDSTAVTLCMVHHLPIVVFDLQAPDGIVRAARGERIGTLIGDTKTVYADAGVASQRRRLFWEELTHDRRDD